MSTKTHVEIFDPSAPSVPVTILRLNFDPGQGHRRWRHRPAKEAIPWAELDLAGDGTVLADSTAKTLAADFPDHCALVEHGDRLERSRGIGKATAKKIREWAAGQVAHEHAVAEMAAEAETKKAEAAEDGEAEPAEDPPAAGDQPPTEESPAEE